MANKKPTKKKTPPRASKVVAKASKKSSAVKAPAKKAPPAKVSAKAAKPVAKTAKPVAKPAAKPAPSKKIVKTPAPKQAATPARKPVKAAPAKKPVPAKKSAPAPKAAKPAPAPAARAPVPSRQAVRPPRHDEAKPVVHKANNVKRKNLTAKELEQFRKMLLSLRDRIVDEISFLTRENLNNSQREASGDLSNYSLHMADQGTDNFEREFALSLVSTEHDVIYEIDEALHRIENGTYGICEMTGEPIEIARLKVLPYARFSVAAQSQMEKGRGRFRPRSFDTPLDVARD